VPNDIAGVKLDLTTVLKDDKILLHTPGKKPSLMLEPVLQIDF